MSELNPFERIERAEELLLDAVINQKWSLIPEIMGEGARGIFLIEHESERISPFDLAKKLGAPEEAIELMVICNLPSTNLVKAIMQRIEERAGNARRD